MPVIIALERLRQEDLELEGSLHYMVEKTGLVRHCT